MPLRKLGHMLTETEEIKRELSEDYGLQEYSINDVTNTNEILSKIELLEKNKFFQHYKPIEEFKYYEVEDDTENICLDCHHVGFTHAEHEIEGQDEAEVVCPKCYSTYYFVISQEEKENA